MHIGKTKMNMLLGVLFSCAIALGLLGRLLCTRSWKDYAALRPECRIPDSIETVLYDEALDRLCVCYNNANRVNVYDGAGTFLWSVGTPYLRNSEFELLTPLTASRCAESCRTAAERPWWPGPGGIACFCSPFGGLSPCWRPWFGASCICWKSCGITEKP